MDGDSVEYIFKLTEEEKAPDPPISSDLDDDPPEEWSDDPIGVDPY